jgi:glucosamine--fructose-6-phosphate aminotransferase (isomerizing)
MSLHKEILEQPERLGHLLVTQRKAVEEIAAAIKRRRIRFVFLAARGTSDNAGRYANYLLGAMNRLPVALATPSLFTYYERPPNLDGALVIAISQSGQSPDIVRVLHEGKQQGCLTLAITNAPESPLAREAEFVLNIEAGPELAVAATKTYTAELMSIAMLSATLCDDHHQEWSDLEKVPDWIRQTLEDDGLIATAAQHFPSMLRCVVLGRGYNYATAFEWALKLKELAYVEAEPYSPADFRHGPIAMVERGYPVLAVVADGKVADSMLEVLRDLRQKLLAELVVISNLDSALSLSQVGIPLGTGIPEALTPLVSIVAGQLFTYHLTIAKGHDPDRPRTISKVTETR